MKYIPTLFSTEMVQSEIEGRKKMTRRTKGLERINANPDEWTLTSKNKNICRFFSGEENNPNPIEKYWIFEHCISFEQIEVKCPYGVVRDIKEKSDILWVRESFDVAKFSDENIYFYKANFKVNEDVLMKWRPSIHMPKEACRIFLRVTDVRCERLHEITEQDAVDEGIGSPFPSPGNTPFYLNYMEKAKSFKMNHIADNAIHSFQSLWVKINGQSSWDDNPYVWVVSFERCERPADFLPSPSQTINS